MHPHGIMVRRTLLFLGHLLFDTNFGSPPVSPDVYIHTCFRNLHRLHWTTDESNGEFAYHPKTSMHEGLKSESQTAYYPSRWSRYRWVHFGLIKSWELNVDCWLHRAFIREPFAEFLGVAILIMFGNGVNCQVVLSVNPNVTPSPKGVRISISWHLPIKALKLQRIICRSI